MCHGTNLKEIMKTGYKKDDTGNYIVNLYGLRAVSHNISQNIYGLKGVKISPGQYYDRGKK